MSSIPAGTILYHGSHVYVRFPKVQKPKPGVTTDFGNGVYFTLTFRRAREWAKKKANQNHKAYGYITSFRLKQDIIPSAKVKIFDGYSEEWLDFVMNCRKGKDTSSYDIVVGNVADARTYDLIIAYEEGLFYKDRTHGVAVHFGKLNAKEKKEQLLSLISGFDEPFLQVCFRFKDDKLFKDYLEYDGVKTNAN